MNDAILPVAEWFGRTLAVGGGLLLVATALLALVRQPVRQRMIGSVAIRIAMLVPLLTLGPRWLQLTIPADAPPPSNVVDWKAESVPVPDPTPPVSEPAEEVVEPAPLPGEIFLVQPQFFAPSSPPTLEQTPPAPEPEVVDVVLPPAEPFSWLAVVMTMYLGGAALFVGRWLLGHLALRRLLRRSRPAGQMLTRLFKRQADETGIAAQLRVAPKLTAPVCCGLLYPVVLVPQRLAETGDEETLHWVFAHELAHLRHGDAWTAFWFGLAAALYWPLPWFWGLRRRVELCQEYVADAEAAGMSPPEEYAAFLVDLSGSARPGRRLAGTFGVLGSPSELYRRITMLLKPSRRVERACPRRWSMLATGLFMAMALVLSGVGLAREDAPKPPEEPKVDQKKDSKKDAPPADAPKADEIKPGEEKFIRPQRPNVRVMPGFPQLGANATPEEIEAAMRKMLEEAQRQFGRGVFGGGMVPPAGGFFGNVGGGRLGVLVEAPSPALVEQLDLPTDQGLVIAEIQADSAAAKAGLKVHDILLEFNGKAVPSDAQAFRDQIKDIKVDTPVDAIILRKGKRETISGIKLPEAKAEANAFGGFAPRPLMPRVEVAPVPPVPPIPAMPEFPRFNGFAPGGTSLSVSISNGNFSIVSREEGVSITLTGIVEDGKTTVNSIGIREGTKNLNFDKLENVPEQYREKINALLKNVQVKSAK